MRQAELAELAGCGLTTILDFETGRRRTLLENVMAIQHALEERGITFIPATSDLHGGIIGPE
jgi:transcriptional regulator with XRE-family HTH domain